MAHDLISVKQQLKHDNVRRVPGDSSSWESPEKADNVWRLFIQILLHHIPDFLPGM